VSLPKSLTTVTTLSKIVALILFIAMPFIGFYIGYNSNHPQLSAFSRNNMPMMYRRGGIGPEFNLFSGFFGFLSIFLWVLVVINLFFLAIWLYKQISKNH
jgi:hypothetical protein